MTRRIYPNYIGPFPDPRGGTINVAVHFKDHDRRAEEFKMVGNIGVTDGLLSIHLIGHEGWEWGEDWFQVRYFPTADISSFDVVWAPKGDWEGPEASMRRHLRESKVRGVDKE